LRRFTLGSLVLCCVGWATNAAAQAAPRAEAPVLVRLGTYYIPTPSLAEPRGWLGLFPEDGGFALRAVRLTTRAVELPCGGGATEIRADRPGQPLFVVRALPGLRPGPVASYYRGERFLYPGEYVSPGRVVFQAYGAAEPVTGNVLFTDYRLILRTPGRDQAIVRWPRLADDGLPAVLWSGDLDRDGRPDVFMSLKDHYASERWALFLSSTAPPDSLVARVGDFGAPGC
jgi:hypothetical protein